MSDASSSETDAALSHIRLHAGAGTLRITRHAASEMLARAITVDDLIESLASGEVLENYPDHQRGPCCLHHGPSKRGRPVHVVCTTSQPVLIIITAYEPSLPKWKSSRERNR